MDQVREQCYHLAFRVAPKTLSEVRASLAALTETLTPDSEVRHHVLIAIEEAVQNIIRHAYKPDELPGRLEVTVWRDGSDIVFELRDYAQAIDLDGIYPRTWDPSRPGGLGLHLIHAAMDEVQFSHAPKGDGNILLMRKHLG